MTRLALQLPMHELPNDASSVEPTAREIDRVGEARMAAARVIDTIRRRNGLPRDVREFVAHHWQRHLELIHVRLGDACPEWDTAVGVAAELVLAADPTLFPSDPEGPQQVFARIQPELDLGLAMTGMGAVNRALLLQRLRASLTGHDTPENGDEPDAPRERPTPEDARPSYSTSHADAAKRLRVGTWMEFRHPDGRTVRAKLCWASSSSGKRLFVNQQGLKYAEKTVDELAVEMGERRAIVVG